MSNKLYPYGTDGAIAVVHQDMLDVFGSRRSGAILDKDHKVTHVLQQSPPQRGVAAFQTAHIMNATKERPLPVGETSDLLKDAQDVTAAMQKGADASETLQLGEQIYYKTPLPAPMPISEFAQIPSVEEGLATQLAKVAKGGDWVVRALIKSAEEAQSPRPGG